MIMINRRKGWSKLVALFFMLALLLGSNGLMMPGVANAAGSTLYVDSSGSGDFTTIQSAVTAAGVEDTIIVKDGTYTENVTVDKALTIQSENGAKSTIVKAAANAVVFDVNANGVVIDGFSVQGTTDFDGIELTNVNDCIIQNNDCSGCYSGIYIGGTSSKNSITANYCHNNERGISVRNSANGNLISKNTVANNYNVGFCIKDTAKNNVLWLNNVNENFELRSVNTYNSTDQITYTYNGSTYTGYLGNYWKNYAGTDANGDGVGDTPYKFGLYSDNYPLMAESTNYEAVQPPQVPPVLTADNTDNKVAQAIDITFTDDATWRGAITGIKVDDMALTADQYEITAGNINIIAEVFTTAADYTIVVEADGYHDANVTQQMLAVEPPAITITGNGVPAPFEITLSEILALEEVCYDYSAINTWPTEDLYEDIRGVKLEDILALAQIKDEAKTLEIKGSDGYKDIFTRDELFIQPRYYFPGLMEGSSEGKELRPVILSTDELQRNGLRLIMGQRAVTEQNKPWYIKKVNRIIISTEEPEKWENVTANVAEGYVDPGTKVTLGHTTFDAVKIYYTMNESDPDLNSTMYNISASYYQPKLNVPIEITEDTTIKAIAIGSSRKNSDIVSFEYKVNQPSPVLSADSDNNVIGQQIDLTFEDDSAWRGAITEISVGSTVLESNKYQMGEGKITFSADVFPEAGEYAITIKSYGYIDAVVTQQIKKIIPPVLIADTTDNILGNCIELTFDDNEAWGNAISEVIVGGLVLGNDKYSVNTGSLVIDTSVFMTAGNYLVVVKATGYEDTGVIQAIVSDILLTAPALTADTSDNMVGQDVNITFTSDETWEAFITGIKVADLILDPAQYTVTTGNINIAADVFTAAGEYEVVVSAAGYSDATVNQIINVEGLLTPPALTADTSSNIVGLPIDITFTDDPDWRAAISGVSVDGTDLAVEKYVVASGKITINASLFTEVKDYAIVVKSTGYQDAAVTQSIISLSDMKIGNIYTIAGNGTCGYSGDGGKAVYAQLTRPRGVALDSQGNYYIADEYAHCIRKVDTDGNISTIAGGGTSGDGGPATSARLKFPVDVTVDEAGNLYIADTNNKRIRKVDTDGNISTVAGNGNGGYSGDGGSAVSAQLSYPHGIAVDKGGNLYISDRDAHCIRKVDTEGIISTIAGTGTSGSSGDGGSATSAQLNCPYGVAVDGAGNVYISEQQGHRIRKVDTDGNISTVVGTGTGGYSGDGGPATSAQILAPWDVEVDEAGNLYIADTGNRRIRKVDAGGTITTVAGTGKRGYRGDGGPAAYAQFNSPSGITVNSAGDLYIADFASYYIRFVKAAADQILNSPTLVADSINNTVGQAVDITFPTDAAWEVAITGITVNSTALTSGQYTVTEGNINIIADVFTGAGDYAVVVSVAGYSDATVTQSIKAAPAPNPVYTVSPEADAAYTAGTTQDGINTMTVNAGVSGFKYFAVKLTMVISHSGDEVVVFTHFRNGQQLGINATKADFDQVNTAEAGFNVQPDDVVKAYIVDDLINAVDFNPVIFQ